jgi:hypothetical protein
VKLILWFNFSESPEQVWYNDPVLANGYYVTTGLDPPSGDMTDWIIESTASNWSLSMRLLSSRLYRLQMPIKRGADFVFDESVEAPFGYMMVGSQLIFAFGFALSAILGAMGRDVVVPGSLATTFLLSAIIRAVAGLGFLLIYGNYLAYSSIWITTPQVDFMLALRRHLNSLTFFIIICGLDCTHFNQTANHCSFCSIPTSMDVCSCMLTCTSRI